MPTTAIVEEEVQILSIKGIPYIYKRAKDISRMMMYSKSVCMQIQKGLPVNQLYRLNGERNLGIFLCLFVGINLERNNYKQCACIITIERDCKMAELIAIYHNNMYA